MNYYQRTIAHQVEKDFFSGRAIIILGARRTGKSTLVDNLLKHYKHQLIVKFSGDNPEDRDFFDQKGLTFLDAQLNSYSVIFIDEAQKIPEIGNLVKLLVDNYKIKKQVILTGSSSLNILDQTSEPLTGRKFVYRLFPLTLTELKTQHAQLDLTRKLDLLLTFGFYPEVITHQDINQKKRILKELVDSYLYKDILEFQAVKIPQH
jgi:predicted AAA+ superfamily ATPase